MDKKKFKKVLIFMPFIGIGGVEKNLFIISNFLSKKIKDISICTSSTKYKNKFVKNIKFISPKKVPENLNIRIKYLICLFMLFKLFIRDRNFVVISFQANIYCILLCKIFNIRIIIRSNSSPVGWYHNTLKKFIYRKIVSTADEVIVNSSEFKNQMETRFNIKVNKIYNPLNKNEIKRKSSSKFKNSFFQKKYLNIINVGRLVDQKDQITILRAINNLKNKLKIKLIIIGRGKEKNNLINFINQNKLKNFIKIKGPNKNVYNYLRSADLFILSSKYEGLPNVLLEALTLKKFVISTNCPTGPKEILLNGNGGLLFNIGDHNQLTKKIFYYFKNKDKCKKKLRASIKALKRFDYSFNLNQYFKIVKKYL